jgi:CubicO group peptidase (beta-lactamase class C family)
LGIHSEGGEKIIKNKMLIPAKLILWALLITLVFSLLTLPISARAASLEPEAIPSPVPMQQGSTDAQELEAFLDGVIAAQLEAYHIPGATVAVVKDGELLFAKGYGYADLERQMPVVADRTLFRPGSISKLFTWTAVMQLVEQGKLDLNVDVNTYLKDFQIPATYPQPITLEHLLTHTPGFEFQSLGGSIFVRSSAEITPLGEYLVGYMPARVRPPGELIAYTNYGAVLAGYIVEKVSGMPFEQYVEENIFEPLGMRHSTFRQPPPPDLAANVAVGYTYADGAYRAGEFEWLQTWPAGALSATATDMAKFMIAHLQNGRYGEARILQEATAQEMHRQHFTHDPRVSGCAYGFLEMHVNNQRIIGHGGATLLFHSILVLLPEQDVGLFASYNSAGGAEARLDLLQAFLDHYYPAPKSPAPQPPADFAQRAARFTGGYLYAQSNQTTLEKLMRLFQPLTAMVSATGDGTLRIEAASLGGPAKTTQWVEVEPLVFRNLVSQELLVFREGDQGHVTHMFRQNDQNAYIRLPWYGTVSFHWALLASCMLLFLSAVLVWPVGFLVKRLKRIAREPSPILPRLARWLAWGLSALSLFFLVAFLSMLGPDIVYGFPPAMTSLLVVPWLVAALTIGMTIFTVVAWVRRYWGVTGRVYYTLLTLVALSFVWWLSYWNLLGALPALP